MGKRIKQPVNREAFALARHEFYKKHSAKFVDETGRHTVPLNDPRYKKYRKEWLKLYEKHGGQTDDGKAFQGKDPATAHEPCGYDNKIAAVHVLDGDKDTYLVANGTQHVNLPIEDKWVDGTHVSTKDRLGRKLRVKIEFTKRRKEEFTVALLSHRHNAEYTDQEKAARASFLYQRADADQGQGAFVKRHGDEYTGRTDRKGVHVTDYVFEVTPAVGDRYLFVAWDTNDNRVYSVEIKTVRTVYYMTLQTTNAPQAVPHGTYRPRIEGVYRALHTEMIHLGHEDLGNAHADPIAPNDFLDKINQASDGNCPTTGKPYSSYSPFLLRFAFVDQLATSIVKTTLPKTNVPVGTGKPAVRLPVQVSLAPATDPTADMRKPLWIGLGRSCLDGSKETVPGNHWFVSATIRFPDGTSAAIPHTHCTPVETDPHNAPGIYNEIDIRVDHLPANPSHGDVTLKAILVNRMVLGLAKRPESPGSMIMASRHHGQTKSHNAQMSAAIHEVGHSLQMVAKFSESSVETHQYYYLSDGNHCHYSIAHRADGKYQSDPAAGRQAGCLMFGFVATPPLFTFCADCQASMRKVDMSEGFV